MSPGAGRGGLGAGREEGQPADLEETGWDVCFLYSKDG